MSLHSSTGEIIAVIDIGSSAIRLLVAQRNTKDWDVLDSAEQPLALGRDVFSSGSIGNRTVSRAIEILCGFQELMAPYGVNRVVAIGTSALRESVNREMFVDRVLLQTGIEVRVIDGVEANQLTWLAVRKPLKKAINGFTRHNSLIIEVGAGNTELMILHHGKVASSHALSIGTLRFLQRLDKHYGSDDVNEMFRRHAVQSVRAMAHELNLERISKLVAVGGDARLVAARLGKKVTKDVWAIPRDEFRSFKKEIGVLSPEEIIARIDLPWNEAELLYPAMVIFDTFFDATRADEILVPQGNIRQGLLINYAASPDALRSIFSTQVLAGAMNLAKHYRTDMKHIDFVREQSLILYDELTAVLGLKGYHRLFLEAAAILHDVGLFIGGNAHHKHGQYIVRNSDIFGLSASDKELISHVVRYHRRAKPHKSHNLYMALSRSQRILVQKLAALLRVADALDRSHSQRVSIRGIALEEDFLVIFTDCPGDLSLEELSLADKGDLFEDVFGLKPVLRKDHRPQRSTDL